MESRVHLVYDEIVLDVTVNPVVIGVLFLERHVVRELGAALQGLVGVGAVHLGSVSLPAVWFKEQLQVIVVLR